MRWVLVLCAMGTTVVLHAAGVETRAGIRAVRSGLGAPVPLLATQSPEPALEVADEATPAAAEASPTKPPPSRGPARLPPALAMLGETAVARGLLVDETGAPVLRAEIRGMSWRPVCGGRRDGVRGYARDGVFVFRYHGAPPFFRGPPREDGTFPEPKITFWVEAPGFVHEEFEAEPNSAALRRGDSVEGLTIVLRRGAIVQGTVFGPDGKPCSGVDVGVVDDPLAFRSDYRTRRKTDEQGRFRLVDLDPRRKLWIHARNKKLLARPLPLDSLLAGVVTHRVVSMERVRKLDVSFEIGATDLNVRICIDYGTAHLMKEGRFRVRLESGPHRCEFKNARDEVVKRIRFWLEPHRPEHYELVRLDIGD